MCLYPLKTKIKKSKFTKRGNYCFDCSNRIIEGSLNNFSLIEAIENFNQKNILKCNLGKDQIECDRRYDLKIFECKCACKTEEQKKNLFSNFFMNYNMIPENQYQETVDMVYKDFQSLYESNKIQTNNEKDIAELVEFKKVVEDSIKGI